jgi:hypothetical protein
VNHPSFGNSPEDYLRVASNQNNVRKGEIEIMCCTTEEMNKTMETIQEWKRIKEEAENNISKLNLKAIEYLTENEEECKTTNKKGKEILQYIGNICKATLSEMERETVDKEEVKKLLSKEDYQKVSKVSRFKMLKVS